MADYVEPSRTFKEAHIARELAKVNLTEAVIYQMSQTLSHLTGQQRPLSPLSIKIYHHWIQKER